MKANNWCLVVPDSLVLALPPAILRGHTYLTSALGGGGGTQKEDIAREVALRKNRSVSNADKSENVADVT